jgi:hypothetical protein
LYQKLSGCTFNIKLWVKFFFTFKNLLFKGNFLRKLGDQMWFQSLGLLATHEENNNIKISWCSILFASSAERLFRCYPYERLQCTSSTYYMMTQAAVNFSGCIWKHQLFVNDTSASAIQWKNLIVQPNFLCVSNNFFAILPSEKK